MFSFLRNHEIENIQVSVCRCPAKKFPQKILEDSQQNTCAGVSLIIKSQASCNFLLKKGSSTGVSLCEFCKTFKSNFFTEHIWATAS